MSEFRTNLIVATPTFKKPEAFQTLNAHKQLKFQNLL